MTWLPLYIMFKALNGEIRSLAFFSYQQISPGDLGGFPDSQP